MKLISIEPTPSPNTMKLNLDESLAPKESKNYKKEELDQAPAYLKKLLEIQGVTGVYHVANFIALERHSKMDWKIILPQVRQAFGEKADDTQRATGDMKDGFGESKVFVQMFRGIPMQVKIESAGEEARFGLPDRFKEAALKAETSSTNLVMERSWKEQGLRYGSIEDIGKEVVEELEAAYGEERLAQLVEAAFHEKREERVSRTKITAAQVNHAFQSEDWKVRYAALEKMDPTEDDIPLLAKALKDDKASIRRLATVYLGMIETEDVLPYLYEALRDSSVTVRRTAGDCLSDIGNPKAIPVMVEALEDKNKLVRWRAAMFLYEVGDESAVEALKRAEEDPEFEVSLQVKMARERIESGAEAAGSVWQQMTNARKQE